jgi:hypothetical protein
MPKVAQSNFLISANFICSTVKLSALSSHLLEYVNKFREHDNVSKQQPRATLKYKC